MQAEPYCRSPRKDIRPGRCLIWIYCSCKCKYYTKYTVLGRWAFFIFRGVGAGLFLLFYVVVVVVTRGKLYANGYDLSKTPHRSVLWLIVNSYYWCNPSQSHCLRALDLSFGTVARENSGRIT